jgi:predicted cation transporter
MPTTKIEVLQEQMEETPLVERGRIERMFQGLGLFAASIVLLYGIHLLMKAFTEPLEASEMTVIGAGFMLALASFGIAFLVWPSGRTALGRNEHYLPGEDFMDGTVLTVYGNRKQSQVEANRLLAERRNLPGPM